MSEGKVVLPAYGRAGKCANCGADIYAPESKAQNGGLPRMSACACPGGPRPVDETPPTRAETGKAQAA